MFFVSEPDLPKDSTTHVEIVGHVLTQLQKDGVCLRDSILTLQVDNTSRECKNNTMVQFLASLVSKGLLVFDYDSDMFSSPTMGPGGGLGEFGYDSERGHGMERASAG